VVVNSWPAPFIPSVIGEPATLHLRQPSGDLVAVAPGPIAGMYVCGITPYDATHLGHAATYVTFDVLQRVLRDGGHQVKYVQNVTDVDDPLLERAARDGVDWRDLAASEIALFHEDMAALAVLPPDHYVSVVDTITAIAADVETLVTAGMAYYLPAQPDSTTGDVYFDARASGTLGAVCGWSQAEMMAVFADRGGDPDRPGKRDPFDALLWRAARPGEPSWDGGELGRGRPGWHIECTTIALQYLGMSFDIQGGGTDLIFPHHDFSAAHAQALTGQKPFAQHFVHQAMVGLAGEKMSKSQGNLVLVSTLRATGHDPMAIRLLLLGQHYATDWSYTDQLLEQATTRLDQWRCALSRDGGPPAVAAIAAIRQALADDLDTPGALTAVDQWAQAQLANGGQDYAAAGELARAIDSLLGIRL
jgi:L-cysteine:1D-myo-inositol 2-amino-2-deoxy-alpha-D-glucopyranoside ligase